MTLKEAIDAVAARAAERRGRPATYQEKVALELSNALSAAGDFLHKSDAAKGALIGGGIGALGGAGSALAGPGSMKDKAKRAGRSLLGGGLAGAAVGGGLGMAKQNLGGLKPGAGPSGEGGTAGTFTGPGGAQMKIDPKILKARPELGEQVAKLTTPSVESRIGEGIGAAAGGAFQYAPITSLTGGVIAGNEARRAFGGNGLYNADNLKASLREKDIGKLLGDDAKPGLVGKMSEAEKLKMIGQAKGGFTDRLKSMFGRGPNPDDVLHSGTVTPPAVKAPKGQPPAPPPQPRQVNVTRADVNDLLRSGRNANRILGGKIPPVAGRNAMALGAAGVADLARHAYLGHRDDVESRRQLRDLMSQVAKETANRGS